MIDWGVANPAAANAALLSPVIQRVADQQQRNAALAQTQAQTGLIGAQTQQTQAQVGQTLAQTQQIEAQIKNIGAQTAGQIIQNKAAEFQTSANKFKLASQIFSSVALNPSQDSYDAAMTSAAKLGIDTSDAPPMWGAAAQSYVQNKSILTGQALQYYQAQYGMMVQRANMINQINQTNARTLQANAGAATAGIQGGLPLTSTSGIPVPSGNVLDGIQEGGASQSNPDNVALNPTASNEANPSIGQVQQGSSGQGNTLLAPAQVEQQKEQQKALTNFQTQLGQTDAGYANRKRLLAQAGNAVSNLPYTNPIIGGSSSLIGLNAFGRTEAGESLTNATAGLQLDAFNNNISQSFKRAAPQVFANLDELQPSLSNTQSTNQLKLNAINYVNEGTHAMSLLSPYIAQTGQTIPQQSQMLNKAMLATGAVDQKTGAVDLVKLQTWPQFLPKGAQDALKAQGNDGSFSFSVTPAEIDQARKKGATDADIMKAISALK